MLPTVLMLFAAAGADPKVTFDELKAISASLEAEDSWLNVVKVQSGACRAKSPTRHLCPVPMTLEPTAGDQLFYVSVDAASLRFADGTLSWTPPIIEYGKGLFRTFGNPVGKSCGANCWMPEPETLRFEACAGALPPAPKKIEVVFKFDGPWRSRQWSTARTTVVAIRVIGDKPGGLECLHG